MEMTIARKCAPRLAEGMLVLAVLTLSGCIPAPLGKYYQPRMDTHAPQHYSGTDCYGQAGAPAVLHVSLGDGVNLRIDAMPPVDRRAARGDRYIWFSTFLAVPPCSGITPPQESARMVGSNGVTCRCAPVCTRTGKCRGG